MNYVLRYLTLILISFLIHTTTSYAMLGTTGKIAGRVIDRTTGEPLPFVNIILVGTSLGAASDIDGYYTILNIPPGDYDIKASAIGYNSVTIQNIEVYIDKTTQQDFELSDTSIELGQEVTIIATKPLIQRDRTSTTSIVDDDLISELPVTEIGDVLSLQAGIVVSPGGELHVRGGRSGQVTYQIDGVPVTDAYNGSAIVEVNTSSVQELQVISGAFNAEYGQALSGVVNLVTKDGNNQFTGSLSSFIGDYVSLQDDIFWNIKDYNPISIINADGSISGPIIRDKLFFFANLRYYKNTGYFYGRRDFWVTDKASEVPGSGGSAFTITQYGEVRDTLLEGEYTSMNPFDRISGQGKLTYNLFSGMRLSYNLILDQREFKFYDHNNKLTPDNNLQRFENSVTNIFNINHAVSAKSFYTLNLSYFFKRYKHYLFEDIYTGDPTRPTLYVDNTALQTPPYSFAIGGTNSNRFERSAGTYVGKLDWATQFTQEINVQFGGEFRRNTLFFHNINLVAALDSNGQKVTPYNVTLPPLSSVDRDLYERNPIEGSAYVQAKFEAFNLIFNIGGRFDVFSPDGVVLNDPTDPNIYNPLKPGNQFNDLNGNGKFEPESGETPKTVDDRRAYWYKDAAVKTQFSPRVGLAFPISDRGVIHFSYGHFFQLPRYELLYTNPDFKLGVGSGNQGVFGNADLEPQKTVKGEIGLQQQLSESIAVDVTVFFEDFRNLTGTQVDEVQVFGGGSTYSQYSNSDFGFSRGFIVKLAQRFTDGLAVNLDYTFSVTKGNASNPADSRNAIAGGAVPETFIAPLDWDQSHTLNLSVAYTKAGDWGFSIIGNFYSGQPYTPGVNKLTRVTQNAFPRNSDSKPNVYNIDLRAFKDFTLFGQNFSAFLRVFNLLDLDNPLVVYNDSGDPFFNFGKLEAERIQPTLYNNTLDELYTNPGFFSEPRRIEFGLSYNF